MDGPNQCEIEAKCLVESVSVSYSYSVSFRRRRDLHSLPLHLACLAVLIITLDISTRLEDGSLTAYYYCECPVLL
jgi:hypothetical protein